MKVTTVSVTGEKGNLDVRRDMLPPEAGVALSELFALFPAPGDVQIRLFASEQGGGFIPSTQIHGSRIPGLSPEVFAEAQALIRRVDAGLAGALARTRGTWYL